MRALRAVATALILLSAPAWAEKVGSVMLMYQAHESGVAPYSSRILVTERYVRMDDGIDKGDYLIFDRQSRLISSVTHNDQTVFEIPPREITLESPIPLKRRSKQLQVENAPTVGGRQPQQHQLYVNDTLCYNVVAVPGLMGDAVQALRDFRRVLAGEHAKALPDIPADMQQACDLALHTFHYDWQLQFGLPIQEWDEAGNGQVLMDYKQDFMVDESLFGLPENYHHYNTDSL
jgi:hypothetical protein